MAADVPAPTPRVAREWSRQVIAEYRSCAMTQQLCMWITRAGLSPDLIHEGLAVGEDELVHAELAMEVARAAGFDGIPDVLRHGLAFRRNEDEALERDITRACVRSFCLGETVAVPLFKAMRDRCRVEVGHAFFERVLRDEVRHREFGWVLLHELLSRPNADELRAVARESLPESFTALRTGYVVDPGKRVVTPEEEAWGLLPTRDYEAIIDRTVERDYRPRFQKMGIEFPSF